MTQPFKIGIAGLGTVGTTVIEILQKHAAGINARAERPIEIVAVSARTKDKKRAVDISDYEWVANPVDLAARRDLDCVIEVMGGEEGAALDLVRAALENGKHVITANKAMLAHHGYALALLAEQKDCALSYEAAVAGGIPVIRAVREGLSPNAISAVHGILNGTCNYILTQMRESGRDFEAVLEEAQAKGYAEADPGFDIDGIDAAHKLSLLVALCFGVVPDFDSLSVTGIRAITAADIKAASEMGYKIKLLGSARRLADGSIAQSLEPVLIPADKPMASVEDVFNAVVIEGDFVGTVMLEGRGAGGGPTATSIVADLTDLARGEYRPIFGIPAKELPNRIKSGVQDIVSPYYLRFEVQDKPGVLAALSGALRDAGISIETMNQPPHGAGEPARVIMVTHEADAAKMARALADIKALETLTAAPMAMRIEMFASCALH